MHLELELHGKTYTSVPMPDVKDVAGMINKLFNQFMSGHGFLSMKLTNGNTLVLSKEHLNVGILTIVE